MEHENRNVLLSVRDVKQYFPVKKTKLWETQRYVRANDGISLDIYAGETLGLVGESGCGKSTLGRTLLQLYPQTHGQVLYYKDGKEIDLKSLSKEEMRVLRKDLQLIFQDPYSSLNPRMTVGQIIGEGLVSHGVFKRGDPAMRDYIFQVMENCGLATYMFGRYPHQFSGGQRQRHRHRPQSGPESLLCGLRRGCVGSGRVYSVPDSEPAVGFEGTAEPDLSVHHP